MRWLKWSPPNHSLPTIEVLIEVLERKVWLSILKRSLKVCLVPLSMLPLHRIIINIVLTLQYTMMGSAVMFTECYMYIVFLIIFRGGFRILCKGGPEFFARALALAQNSGLGLGLECTSELLVNRLVNLNISFLAKFRNLYSYFVT